MTISEGHNIQLVGGNTITLQEADDATQKEIGEENVVVLEMSDASLVNDQGEIRINNHPLNHQIKTFKVAYPH